MAVPSAPVLISSTLWPSAASTRNTVSGTGSPVSASRFTTVRLGRMSFSRMMVEVLPGKSSTWRSTGSLMWSEVVSSSLTEYTPGSRPEIRISPFSSVVRSRYRLPSSILAMRKVTPASREPSALSLMRCREGWTELVNTNRAVWLASSWMMRWASSMM